MKSNIANELELYKKMYACLFNAITDSEKLETKEKVIEFLREKQCETEELYISFDE